jgi:hypothetical protein
MIDHKGKEWSQGISQYIPWTELYPMFRNHFAGLEVQLDHPHAEMYRDKPQDFFGDLAAKEGRQFISSGRTVIVSNESAGYIRPIGDLTDSVWVNAELRLDSNLERYATKGLLLACNVDPFEFGQSKGRGAGQYYGLGDTSQLPTFYIRISGGGHGKDLYLPMARLVDVNTNTGEATFELDESVESFIPEGK